MFQASDILSPQLQATFNIIIEAFLFLDKKGKGKLNRKDVVQALNEASSLERSPSHVTHTRFSIFILSNVIYIIDQQQVGPCFRVHVILLMTAEEMDWNRKGKVGFREFLFAFIDWVGMDSDDEAIEIEN